MKTIYLECTMGAAGDMLMAALLELYDRPQEFIDRMNGLGIPGVRLEYTRAEKCGIQGSSVQVRIHGEEEKCDGSDGHGHHCHHTLAEIQAFIMALALPDKVKENAAAVYERIAQAEAQVHNRSAGDIHFHEVGTKDAVADIVGCCLLMDLLAPDAVIASPVHVGSGFVKCAHGILPVPAPATAVLLQGIPIYGGEIQGELCTPTGAALLTYFVSEFKPMPTMRVEKVGYGMGQKEFPAVNCLRAYLGESDIAGDDVVEISCNLDDMTGEAIGYTAGKMMDAGALDVFTIPITMKKGRPAVLLTCLCRPRDEQLFTDMMLKNTTTLGVRVKLCRRTILTSSSRFLKTPYGIIRWKTSCGSGIEKGKPEYEDVQAAAKASDVSFETVWQAAKIAAQSNLSYGAF